MKSTINQEVKVKLIIVGDSGVGKTSFIDCVKNGPGKRLTNITTGPEYVTERVMIDNLAMKVNIWDTAGQEIYRAINRNFYKGCYGAILLADLGLAPEQKNLEYWLKELQNNADSNIKTILCGNKVDLNIDSDTQTFLKQFSEEKKLPYFETSAVSGENVKESLIHLLKQVKLQYYADVQQSLLDSQVKKKYTNHSVKLKGSTTESEDSKSNTCCNSG